MSTHAIGPGWNYFRCEPKLARNASASYGAIQSPGKGLYTGEIRGRGLWGEALSLTDPTTRTTYKGAALQAKLGVFNNDFNGHYLTDPVNYTDVPVDNFFLLQDSPDRQHAVYQRSTFGPKTGQPLIGRLFSFVNFFGGLYSATISRPIACYAVLITGSLFVQSLRVAANARQFIIVQHKVDFDYDGIATTNHRFTESTLVDAGGVGSGANHVGKQGFLQIPIPTPRFPDPLPNNTGYVNIPYFDISWDDWQAQFMP